MQLLWVRPDASFMTLMTASARLLCHYINIVTALNHILWRSLFCRIIRRLKDTSKLKVDIMNATKVHEEGTDHHHWSCQPDINWRWTTIDMTSLFSCVPAFAGIKLHYWTRVVKTGKVFPYSLASIGPRADPGVQAVSPQVGCHYFLPGLWSPSQPKNVAVLRPVPSYTAC